MMRESRIREYLDMLELGDELYGADLHRVTRKRVTHTKSNLRKEIITEIETETIAFS